MAYCKDFNFIDVSNNNLFKKKWHPGDNVEQSGIYRCINCGLEAACNAGTPFTTQNKHQHPMKEPIIWELVVATNSLEEGE